jgi:hypothetical protein
MSTAVISVYKVANFPDGGGHFWVYMQYVQALRRLGCDVYWLEQFKPDPDPEREQQLLKAFHDRMNRFGLAGKTLLYTRDRDRAGVTGAIRFVGASSAAAEAMLARADLLLNFHYAIDPRLLALVSRTALVDIDPALLQYWMSTGQLAVAPHDYYFTTGDTVGTPGARFSDCGLPWIHIRPPICLDLWPRASGHTADAFTSISTWLTTDFLKVTENGKTVLRENTKRSAFLPYIELPRRTNQPLELALFLTEKDVADRALLERNGWRVCHSRDVAGTPEAYRTYIQRSRGEFSCAKPSCIEFQNAWISDRTICYLASGRPAVVQHTGPSSYLPSGEGLFRFSTLDEAVAALDAVNTDYERHCRAAREIAETHFDAGRIVEQILNDALGSASRTASDGAVSPAEDQPLGL